MNQQNPSPRRSGSAGSSRPPRQNEAQYGSSSPRPRQNRDPSRIPPSAQSPSRPPVSSRQPRPPTGQIPQNGYGVYPGSTNPSPGARRNPTYPQNAPVRNPGTTKGNAGSGMSPRPSRPNAANGSRPAANASRENRAPVNRRPRQQSGVNAGPQSGPQRRPAPVDPELRRRERAKAEMEQTVRARKKAEARAERRKGLETVGRFLVYVILAVFMISLLVGGAVLIALFHTPDAPVRTGTISYYYGGTKVRTAEASRCVEGGEIYVCFNDLADYLGMKESGSASEMKFILRTGEDPILTAAGDGTEESVTFYTDEHRVVINGQTELLDVPNILIGEEIWVSTTFLTEWMENLSVSYKPNQRTVKVSRILDEKNPDPESESKPPVYLPITFRLKQSNPLESIEEDPGVGLLAESMQEATPYELNFQTDLADYEQYMNPQGALRDEFLVLVNAEHPLTASDVPRDLNDVIYTSTARNTQQLREYPTRALEALFKEMHHYGYYNMAVYSGYRSYDYQSTIFEQYVQNEMTSNPNLSREEAEALVLTYSTRPGTSEHQTGLAVDMDTMGSFTTDFAWTSEYYWLQENAWKFGFILRFPSDKTQVTSISFEPWHYRYVGRYHAKIIHDNGLCLEEYIARISH